MSKVSVDPSDAETEELQKVIENVVEVTGAKSWEKSEIYRRQWLTAIILNLPLLLIGASHGHSTILMQELDPLKLNTSLSKIDNGEIFGKPDITVKSLDMRSWIISIMLLANCPGCWVLAVFSQRLGRKQMLTTSMSLFFVAWTILAFSTDSWQVLISRCFIGFSAGIVASLIPAYQGECGVPELRATLNVMHSSFVSLGVGLTHALSFWFHWRTISLFAALISLFTAILICCRLEESPVWLLRKKKFHAAVRSWAYWRVTHDLDQLKSMHFESPGNSIQESSVKKPETDTFCVPSFLKPLGIIMIFFTTAQLSGMGAVTHYCIQMINDIAGADRAYAATIILDTFRFTFSLTSTFFTKRFGPRAVALGSTVSSALLLISLSAATFMNLGDSWFALALLFVYEAAVITGLVCLPWSFCSELFPTSYKEVGIGIASSYNFSLFFLVLKLNPILVLKLQASGVFLLYGICTTVGSLILYFILPDTKNKSLREIELMFSNG